MNGNKLLKRYSAVEGGFSFLGAVLASLILSVIVSLIAQKADVKSGTDAYVVLNFCAGLAVQGCFLAAAFLPAKALGSRPTYTFAKPSLRSCLIGVVIAALCVVGFEGLALAFNMMLVGNGYVDNSALAAAGGLALALTAVRAVLVAPVCEEALFRGSVLSSLEVTGSVREKFRVPFMVAICGLLFALMHMNPMQTVYQFFLGGTLAYVTLRFGSIVPAIVIHLTNNVIGVVLSLPAVSEATTGLMNNVYGTPWFALFIGASVLLAACAVAAIRALCLKFGGRVPLSPDKEKRTEGGSFRNEADDSGTLAGIVLLSVGAIICVAMWVAALMAGFPA